MKWQVIKVLVSGFLLIAVILHVSSQYALEQKRLEEQNKILQKVEDLATKPTSRPDAWTKTMDDERTRHLCQAIIKCSGFSKTVFNELPEVCRNGE